MVFCPLFLPLRVLRCREFLRTYGKTRKSSFLSLRLIFFEHFKTFSTILFYSKLKVLQIPEILSTIGASYDKISLLWLLAKFQWKIFFWKKNFRFRKKHFSSKLCEGPQKRDFVARCSYGAQNFRNLQYFQSVIK